MWCESAVTPGRIASVAQTRATNQPAAPAEPLLVADQVVVEYPTKGFRRPPARVLHGVSVENAAGQPSFKAHRRHVGEHRIEEVGAKLRAMMPWIAKNKLVDQAKN